jgi:tetratricopeptide (TPR) repeat protein
MRHDEASRLRIQNIRFHILEKIYVNFQTSLIMSRRLTYPLKNRALLMRHSFLTPLLIAATATPLSQAQSIHEGIAKDAAGGCAIWGQIVTPGRSLEQVTDVELVDGTHKHSQKTRAINGNFDFRAVPPGMYQFRVLDRSGRLIYRMANSLKGDDDHVIIVVPQIRSPRSAVNVVSFRELGHKIDAKARKEFEAAKKAFYDGKLQTSSEHLIKALDIDPQFMEARTTLADAYAQMDRLEEALQQAQKAYETNPAFPESAYDYAILLMATKHYEMCETVVRGVMRNQNYVAELKATLAISLISQGRNLAEALALLEQAGAEFPMSRLLAASALVDVRQPDEARNQLKAYLNSANKCERKQVEAWIQGSMPGEHTAGH